MIPTTVQQIPLKKIMVDPAIQSRVKTDMAFVHEFAEAMNEGAVFPPVVVFEELDVYKEPSGTYWLADGFHRIEAYKIVGKTPVPCIVNKGTQRDATIYSAGANKKFSIKRTVDDVKKSIEMLMRDEEWSKKSNTLIASHVGINAEYCRLLVKKIAVTNGMELPKIVEAKGGKTYHVDREQRVKNQTSHRLKTKPKTKCPNCGHEW